MACNSIFNERYRDLNVVRVLAKKAANALSVDMKIYKTVCDGIQVFKFSEDWSGEITEIVQFDRSDKSNTVLQNNEDFRNITIKSDSGNSSRKTTTRRNLGTTS